MRFRRHARRGTAALEFALVGSITTIILLGLIIGGLGISDYQQVAYLAREASRYASTHGAQYATDTKNAAATATSIYNNAIVPHAVGLNLNQLTYTVTWNTSNAQFHTVTVGGVTTKVANTVSVTVTYKLAANAYLGGITLKSTAVATISY